jgi:hypothetical protein
MEPRTDVLEAIRKLEAELEETLRGKQEEWKYRIELGRAQFETAVAAQHRQMRTRLGRYLRESSIPTLLTTPIIYSVGLPFLIIDAWVTLYQWVCFPIYGIPRVRRRDFIALDRRRLQYLNGIEKANCEYCGYANGVIAYVREVTARTEQYWCPIKHARAVRGPHQRYRLFVDYGDAEGYHRELQQLRDALRKEK